VRDVGEHVHVDVGVAGEAARARLRRWRGAARVGLGDALQLPVVQLDAGARRRAVAAEAVARAPVDRRQARVAGSDRVEQAAGTLVLAPAGGRRDACLQRVDALSGRRPAALAVADAAEDRHLARIALLVDAGGVRGLERRDAAGALAVAAAVRRLDAVPAGADRERIRVPAAEAVPRAAVDLDEAALARDAADQLAPAAATLPLAAAVGGLPAVAVRAAAVPAAAVHLREAVVACSRAPLARAARALAVAAAGRRDRHAVIAGDADYGAAALAIAATARGDDCAAVARRADVGKLEQAVAAGALAGGSAGRRRRRGAPRPMHTIEASRIVASPPTPSTRYNRGFPHPPFIASPLRLRVTAYSLPSRYATRAGRIWRRCQGVVKRNSGLGNPMHQTDVVRRSARAGSHAHHGGPTSACGSRPLSSRSLRAWCALASRI